MGGITRGIANRLGAGGVGTNFRNILINGDMSVDQRGSATGLTADEVGHGADRFYVRVNSRTNFVYSMENSTDVPSGEGFSNSHKITTTTAETSLGSTGILRYGQRIEGNMLKGLKYGTTNAQKLVVQFWVKCSVTGTFIFELWNRKTTHYNSKSFTIDSANTWQKIIKTFDGDTVNDFTIDPSVQLEANVWWAAGTSFSSSGTVTGGSWDNDATKRAGGISNAFTTTLNATFFTTGWQLEVGTSTSAFERLPIDINLQRCQRYYYRKTTQDPYGPIAQGMQIGGSNCMTQGYHPVPMRAAPSISISGSLSCEHGTASSAYAISGTRRNIYAWSNEQSISSTDGSAAVVYGSNDANAYFEAEAEI